MARDTPTTVRLEELLDKFYEHLAKKDRRTKATLMANTLEDVAIEHGFLEWAEDLIKQYPHLKPIKRD